MFCCHHLETPHNSERGDPHCHHALGPRKSAASPAPAKGCQGGQSGHSSHLLESRSSRKESVLPPTVGCKPCSHRPAFERVLSNFRCTGRGYFRHQDRFLAAKSKPQRSWCPALLHLQSSEARPRGWGWCLNRSPSAEENHALENQRRLTFCLDCAKWYARLPALSPAPSTGNYSDKQKQQPFQQKNLRGCWRV